MADKEYVEQLEKDKVELQNKLDHSQRETNRLEEQWKAKVERDTEQQKELEEAKKETRQLQTKLEEAKEELKEEQRKAEEAKDQLQNKHKQHLITRVNDLKEEQQATLTELKEEHKKKLEEQDKEHLAKLQEQKQKFENEKKDNEEKLRKEVTKKVTDEMESSKIKKMARSLFEAESKLEKAETRIEDLKTENNGLSKTIQEKEKEHQNDIAKLRKESRTDSQKQIDELKERDRQLKAKEEEVAVMKRRYNEVQAHKEKLENELQLHKKAVSIKVPPLPPQDSTVAQDDESPTHTKSSYNELLLKNSELGYLAQKLQKDLDALTKAKAEMETELEQMKIEIEPLRERHKDDMTKMRNLNFEIDSKQKLLEKSKKEKSELNSDIDELKKELAIVQGRIKNKELKIVELQRSKLEREKQLTALRTELNEIKEETRKKGKETQKQVPLIRPRDAASPRPPPTPPTRSAAPIDTTLAAKRVVEYKKARELESKVEELTNQLQEMRIEKNKMQMKCEELERNVKRRDGKFQKVSKENTKLREENQLLEESRDRNKKELMNEWTTSHKELELAHAHINKLQLQKSDLLVQLERATPSPDLTMSPRTSSPHRRSPSPIMRIPTPIIISSPSHLPVPITHGPHQSQVIVPQPITEEDFGSQWSLASNESILKEQLEQMEYDKDEVSIEYEELKMSHGKLKGLYRALCERYNSLLKRTKNIHSKAQQSEKERLQLEKELSLLQAKTQNEYDVERETNLRERLKKSLQRINELEAVLEEQFDKSNNEGELEEEKERNRELNESIEQLTLELYNKKSELEEKELSLTEQEEHVKELESQLAETVGQLEGEIAISSSIKQSMQNRTEGHLVTTSPFKAPGSLSFKAKDCLQSVNDTVQQIKRETSKELSVHTASTCENLVEQVERKLNEATQLIEGGHVALKREREEEEEGFDDTDSVAPSTSGQGNSKKFQGWMEKFQTDKNALNSKIAYLEERLSEGSHKVIQLQSLVSELEGRLNREQSLHVSLLAERDEHITSLSDQIHDTQRVGQKVLEALDETNEAEAEEVDSGEANKLDRAVQELLATVYPRGSTPYSNEHSSLSPHMMSSIGPSMMNHQSTDMSLSLSSSNPSPIKTSSHNSSYPTLVPPTEPLTGRRVARAGKVVPKTSKSHLFVALFDYNPKSYCSTGHPERELTLKTGDIISVYGDMDSSGYYNAEYKGQCGLVPAAFIQRMDISDAGSQKRLLNQNLTGSQTNDVIEVPTKLAPPTMFRADRQSDGESLLLSWIPPSIEEPGDLVATGYTLYCDESKIIDINSSSIRQALLKGIDMNSSHVLGICSVSKMDPTTVPFSSAMCYYKYGGVPKPYRAVRDYDPEIDSTSLSHPLHLSHESGVIEELEFDEGDTLIIHGKMHEDSFYYGELNGRFGLVPSNYFQEVAESEATPTHNEREENEPVTEIADT